MSRSQRAALRNQKRQALREEEEEPEEDQHEEIQEVNERGGRRSARGAHSNDVEQDEDAVIKVAGNDAREYGEMRDDEIAELDCGDSSGSEPVENGVNKN